MPDNEIQAFPKVAVIMEVPPPKEFLRTALAEARIPIAAECNADELRPDQLSDADVILITLDEAMEPYLDRVTDLAVGSRLPVVFDACDWTRGLSGWDRNRWIRHLRAKITGSDDTRPPLPEHAANSEQPGAEAGVAGAVPVWVLGASIGGPEAVRRFLEALPDDVPAAFILVQHMGPEFQSVLADRLRRVTNLEVVCAEDGQALERGRVIVAPVGRRLVFGDAERVGLTLHVVTGGASPSIDQVLFEVSEAFGDRAGVIIFSGKDRDGVEGCSELKQHGGLVWTQDAATATISATADAVRQAGLSDYSGTPEQLAARLVRTAQARIATENG